MYVQLDKSSNDTPPPLQPLVAAKHTKIMIFQPFPQLFKKKNSEKDS